MFFCEADSSDTEGILCDDDCDLSSPECRKEAVTITDIALVTPDHHHSSFEESDYDNDYDYKKDRSNRYNDNDEQYDGDNLDYDQEDQDDQQDIETLEEMETGSQQSERSENSGYSDNSEHVFREADYNHPQMLSLNNRRHSSNGSVSDEVVCGGNGLTNPARELYHQARRAKRSASEGYIFGNADWTERYIINNRQKSCMSEEWNFREKDLLEAEETIV